MACWRRCAAAAAWTFSSDYKPSTRNERDATATEQVRCAYLGDERTVEVRGAHVGAAYSAEELDGPSCSEAQT